MCEAAPIGTGRRCGLRPSGGPLRSLLEWRARSAGAGLGRRVAPQLAAGGPVVALHVVALHIHGSNNPTGIDPKGPQDTVPFHPYYTMKVGFGVVVFLIVYAGFVFFAPDYMGHPDNYIPANPLVTPAHIVPEWYFLPFYAILRAVPSKLGGVVLMFGSILILFFLPWIDKSPVRSANYRPLYKWAFWIFVINCLFLLFFIFLNIIRFIVVFVELFYIRLR